MDDFNLMHKEALAANLPVKAFPNTYMLNVTDVNGIVQSYYASTGTAIFRNSNAKWGQKRHTEKDMPFERFLTLCKGEEDIMNTFFN